MATDNERRLILEMIENGKITAEEGLHLLESLQADDTTDPMDIKTTREIEIIITPPAPEESEEAMITVYSDLQEPPITPGIYPSVPLQDTSKAGHSFESESKPAPDNQRPPFPPNVEKWRRWWLVPMYTGIAIMVIGAGLMYWTLKAQGIGFWFACSWVPFFLGVLLIFLAWQSRTARWLHLRIQENKGNHTQKVALSFPIPIQLTAWFLRTFRDKIPGLENISVDELILALGNSANPENPFYLEVNEGENGEQVQVFIG